MSDPEPEYPGDRRHPDHEKYLLALGKATFEAALLSGTCYDILRVWDDQDGNALLRKDMGGLQRALVTAGEKTAGVPGELASLERFDEFMTALDLARELRNDLLHAFPTAHGLARRGSRVIRVEGNVWGFNTPAQVASVTEAISAANRLGSSVLYTDGGDRVTAWLAKQNKRDEPKEQDGEGATDATVDAEPVAD